MYQSWDYDTCCISQFLDPPLGIKVLVCYGLKNSPLPSLSELLRSLVDAVKFL